MERENDGPVHVLIINTREHVKKYLLILKMYLATRHFSLWERPDVGVLQNNVDAAVLKVAGVSKAGECRGDCVQSRRSC